MKCCTINSLFFLVQLLCSCTLLHSQLLYTFPHYSIRKDSAIAVGVVPNYCNLPFTVKLNLYKPVGDGNAERPLAIFIHGGGFTSSDDFNEANMNGMAQEFARRGYVAAATDYREGHHLYPYGTAYPQPTGLGVFLDWTSAARLFITDTAEAIRSVYRAQQDVKGVIRFLKARHVIDSTSVCKVFIGGHSAGGITALAAAYLDQSLEKPLAAGSIAAAPNPQWRSDGFDFFGSWVVTQVNGPQDKDDYAYALHNPGLNFEMPASYLRPDLGPIDGALQDNGLNVKVLGIASLAGAVADTTIFNGPSKPALFLYHQPADLTVNYNIGKPFSWLNGLLVPAPNGNWPLLYGSNWIKSKLSAINYPSAVTFWSYDNSAADPLGTQSHDLLPSVSAVADSVARFFARVMDTSSACPTAVALPVADKLWVRKDHEVAVLTWENTETEALDFRIERADEGRRFSSLFTCKNDNRGEYVYRDVKPFKPLTYYRLATVYGNGQTKYSGTKVMAFTGADEVRACPNPAQGMITLLLPVSLAGKPVEINVYAATGSLVKAWKAQGKPSIHFELRQSGPYIVRVWDGNHGYTCNFVLN